MFLTFPMGTSGRAAVQPESLYWAVLKNRYYRPWYVWTSLVPRPLHASHYIVSLIFLLQVINVCAKTYKKLCVCMLIVMLEYHLLPSHRPLERGFMFVKCYLLLCCC